MAKKFTDEDVQKIKQKLQTACEDSWRISGYKRTNIPLLTKKVGISTGAFYLVYEKKEDLFLDVLEKVQQHLLDIWSDFIKKEENKLLGFKKGMTWLFHEYREYPNLYDVNSQEYELFLAKLPSEAVESLKEKSIEIFRAAIKESKLKLKLSEEDTINIIHSILFLSLVNTDSLSGTEKTFEFLVDHTLYDLFEEE